MGDEIRSIEELRIDYEQACDYVRWLIYTGDPQEIRDARAARDKAHLILKTAQDALAGKRTPVGR